MVIVSPTVYSGPFGGPLSRWCQKLHFSSLCLSSGPFGGPLSGWCQKLLFSPVRLYRGPFGGPLSKWGQKLHFSPVSLFGAIGPKIALFVERCKYQGALGLFLSERGPSGPFINFVWLIHTGVCTNFKPVLKLKLGTKNLKFWMFLLKVL